MMVVNVTAGVMTQSFTVPFVDNNIVECNKNIYCNNIISDHLWSYYRK